jgi:hypothetical protein
MTEKKLYQILDLCLWILNPLLVVLAFYDQQIQPGLFLQWLGKLHPLALHFPIVFGILITIYFLFFQHRRLPVDTEKLLLAVNALFASLVALFGLLFSIQNAYNNELINLHKWGGLAVALLSWIFLYILNSKVWFKKILSIIFLAILIGSTHKGAQLTHGVNALNFPKNNFYKSDSNNLPDSTATIYALGIAPIFNQKCISCHGPDKTKGDLQLNSPENILRGGESGDILEGSLKRPAILFESIHLPQTDEKHMPPDGKLQLTDNEKNILSNWIKAGGNFDTRLNELAQNDSLFLLVNDYQKAAKQKAALNFNLPDLTEFNSNYCTANYFFNGSDEVEVNFFQGSNYNRENLKRLGKIKDQIINLNMQGMPLTHEDLELIVTFTNLQKINLNNTSLDITSLERLKTLTKLKAVSICGIVFNETELDKFLDQATFSSLHVWTHNSDEKQLEKLIKKHPTINIIVGDNLTDEIMKISNPIVTQDSSVFSDHLNVQIKHLLKGVVVRYTSDGSDPDSLKSSEYNNSLRLSGNTVLKIKAFKPGWISSDVVKRIFYKSEIQPDTIFFVTKPHSKYRNNGVKALVDFELGGTNISNGEWLAYKDSNMEFVVGFNQPKSLKGAQFNALVDIRSSIFPVNSITIQGSNDGKQFKNITGVNFPKPIKSTPRTVNTFNCTFPESTSFKYYKFTVTNTKKIPEWHQEKGKPAWIFVDELFLN